MDIQAPNDPAGCLKTILVVEDDEDLREATAMLIRDEGYTVCEAENGRAALEQLATMPDDPCLVLLDLMMPVMSGQELLQAMQRTQRLAGMPVVVLSAGGQAADVPEARLFLRKPFPPDRLLAVVREFCDRS
jgi:two-component system, chemotaxis family, chemotaxis protein CheY